MPDLTDERVREIAAPQGDDRTLYYEEGRALAREVLALRAERIAAGAEGTNFAWPDLVADLRARLAATEARLAEARDRAESWEAGCRSAHQRADAAVAIAREAVEGMGYVDTVVRSAIGNTLAAKLATLTGEGPTDDA